MSNQKKYIIKGGIPLKGKVDISGSKNSALPILSATLLTDKKVVLNNIPVLKDTITMISLLEKLGKRIHFNVEKNQVIVNPSKITGHVADYETVKKNASFHRRSGTSFSEEEKSGHCLPGRMRFWT